MGIHCYQEIGVHEISRRRESVLLGGYYDEIFMDILANEFEGQISQIMAKKSCVMAKKSCDSVADLETAG